jgi:MFS family permease
MACGPWQNYLSTFLSDERGYSINVLGELWSIVGFLGLFSGFALGMLADRIGIKYVLSCSYTLLGLSALLVAMHSNPVLLNVAAICFGLSFFAVYGLIPAYISKTAAADEATTIFADANICLGLGTAAGNVAGGYISEFTGSLQNVYYGVALVAVLAALAVTVLSSERQ